MAKRDCYVEKSQFRSPHIQNGVRGLGDLWNCHNSQSVGHNLFRTAHFSVENLQAHPIKACDYRLTHVKNELETAKTLKVEGHLSLDLLLKIINVEGSFSYRNEESQRENVEVVNCTYINECYQIDLIPPVGAIINSHILQKICDKEIEATHVVGGVIVGAMVSALIEIKDKDSKSGDQVSGSGRAANSGTTGALLKFIGSFSGELKANWESNEANAQLDISVTCKAQPMPENIPAPSSVKKLFELIEQMPQAISKEKHFPMFAHDDITGVPIQFILYPLSHFVDFDTELLYKQLEDDLLSEFQETISNASDIQQQGYIKKLMLEQDLQLKWLLDQKSCLSEKVRESENQLRQVSQRFIKLCRETLKEYKYGRCDAEDLDKIVRDFNASEAGSINEIIEKFVDEGNIEILESKAADGSNKIKRFTDKLELKKWLQSGSSRKALLEVKSPFPSAVVRIFLQLGNPLTALDIEMGMVMPSISEEAKLHLVYEQRELDFKDTEMREALEILYANLCPGNQTRTIFYRVVAELNGIKFPMQKSLLQEWDRTLFTFVQVLSDYSSFYIAESSNDFHRWIRTLPKDTMAFCVPIDAPETALDFFITWKDNILQSLQGVKWVVCSSDIAKCSQAPLLMVFDGGQIHAVCLDQLELQILKHQIKLAKKTHVSDVDFSMFSVKHLQKSLYPERSLYTYRAVSYIAPTTFLDAFEHSETVSINQDVEELIAIITSCLSADMLLIISTAAQIAVENFRTLGETLKTCGWNDVAKTFDSDMLFSDQRLQLIRDLGEWVENKSLLNEIDKAEKLLSDQQDLPVPNEIMLIVHKISDHSHCPATYKRQLKKRRTADLHKRILQILREMRSKTESTESNSIFFHVTALKSGLNCCDSCEQESLNLLTNVLIKEYCRNVSCVPESTETYLQNNQLFFLLRSLSVFKYEKWQFLMYEGLRRLSNLDDSAGLATLIHQLSETCMEEHTEKLWKNDKWLFLIRNCVNATDGKVVLRSIQDWLRKTVNKKVFPEDIHQKLIEALRIETEKENLQTMSDFKTFLEKVANSNEDTPWNFTDVLTESLKQNSKLESELLEANVLVKWSPELKLFHREWSIDEIRMTISKINDELRSSQVKAASAHTAVNFKLDLKDPGHKSDQLKAHSEEPIYPSFHHVMGQNLCQISDTEYLKVRQISDHNQMPQVGATTLLSVMPYLIQQVKLWDGNILKASRISAILTLDDDQENVICDDPFSSDSTSSAEDLQSTKLKQSLNRLDCFAYIINAASCLVAGEILRVLSKFPLSMPLVVPDITEKDKYIITTPLLRNLVVRWETNPEFLGKAEKEGPNMAAQGSIEQGQIIENHLFSSPFRMVVAVRLGTNKTGKSQILNQMMAYPFFFSSRAEAADELGPPCTLHGTVEFTWLTEETCSDWLWTRLLKSHYAEGRDEIVLLANLHGNATQFSETLSYLKGLACCFIVFIMPDCDKHQWNNFKSEVPGKPINCIRIDCGDSKMISTSRLTHTETQDKLRCLIKWALEHKLDQRKSMEAVQTELGKSLHHAEYVKTDESEKVVQLLKSHGCCEIRKAMEDLVQNGYDGWTRNPELQELVISIVNIFNCCAGSDLKKAMIHLETELAKKSATESINPRRNVAKAQRKLQLAKLCINENSRNDASEMLSAEKRMMTEIGRVNDANLGPEHLFRTFGVIYHTALGHHSSHTHDVLNLPKYYADLVLKGHAVEILNGDSGEIPLDWFRAICKNICERQPNLRVFVISIIGLQSSGKSTLLNALFSCRFAVSVGRCSRGLYMRMIFLEEDLRKEHGYDAIIIIDTEGLASPEKMNDPDGSRKDRLLATFAMGLSNLTIVNVLGEELTKMTEILQIVIVTMARLREADVKPDMLVVQHLQERNPSKLDEAKRQFIDAIKRAFDLVHKSNVELGATQNECLTELIHGIHHEDMFLQFSSFKDGSSVHAPPSESYHVDVGKLYKILLNKAKSSACLRPFQRWSQLTENYWHSVTKEKFALNFKNAQHITDFLYFGQKVAKIKEAVGQAFRFHRDIISKKINEQGKQLEDLRENTTKDMISELESIPHGCPQKCDSCKCLRQMQEQLFLEIKDTDWEYDLRETIDRCIQNKQNSELKILKQIFDVSILRNGCFSEFSHLITKELKDELGKQPDGKFSEKEKTEISERIWNRVKQIASSRETGAPLMEEITKAIKAEYGKIHPDICEQITSGLEEDILENEKAKGPKLILIGKNRSLNEKERLQLVQKVQLFITELLTSCNCQCFDIGMKFEAGMIMSIKHNIPDMLQKYEREINTDLLNSYKYTVIVYVLCEFIKKMKFVQDIWDRQNKPSIILHGKETVYKEEIKTRLEHGFSSASDGYVKAGYIIEEIKETAKKAGYRGKIKSVLDHVWTTNTEKVRLQYFEELALKVAEGRKEQATEHFKNPQESVEKWYKEKVESIYSEERVRQIYEQTLTREIEDILLEIRNANSSDKLDSLLQQYQASTKDEGSGSEIKTQENFVSYRDSIIGKIESFSKTYTNESVSYAHASEDTEVMNRLGCTESCPWCGALCWGSRGHHEDEGEIRKHHSCHQPNGLIGTEIIGNHTRFLDPRVCQDIPDRELVFVDGHKNPGVSWGVVKTQYYGNWKFDSHDIKKFDEMMHWFFQELHNDMLAVSGRSPVPPELLEKFKCKDIKLADILAAVRSVKD